MIEQIKIFDSNVIAIEVIDGFTKIDEKVCERIFQRKISKGFKSINILVRVDKVKISKCKVKVFFEDIIWLSRNYNKMGRFAIVAHSDLLKALVSIDNLFFAKTSKGREERYFDVSQIEEAFTFVIAKE
ncbi:SpoIIAA-like [Polaribacter sp. KT25b]|uniref:STAS/SEC14 domain-containing protein n=1 Tax=Polaribacter sp. KT25b TaxID=1855336 RepID=UPI00087A1530|nr:STAS/SEC14 domain-containing protein [Polaribacter sp. KT25b]SDR67187.1 SpoIIAA-like [Polaribacter sp. KT25b]